jgi:hypothetical protein
VKERSGLPVIVYVLLGLLAIAVVLLGLGRRESAASPSAASYGPSGVSALVALLQRSGYSVEVSTRSKPRFEQGDLAIAFHIEGQESMLTEFEETLEEEEGVTIESPTRQALREHLSSGGRGLVFRLDHGFASTSRLALGGRSTLRNTVSGKQYATSSVDGQGSFRPTPISTGPRTVLWTDNSRSHLVTAEKVGSGMLLQSQLGLFATNRFLPLEENAAFTLDLVRTLAPAGARIVFVEAYWRPPSDPSLVEILGPWAEAAWWQVLVLFLVLAYTLGNRFGLPEERRRLQTGARELVEAVANTYRRSRATHAALKILVEDADRQIRRNLKLPLDADARTRNEQLPDELRRAIMRAEVGTSERIPEHLAFSTAVELDDKTREFLGLERRSPRRKRKFKGS